MLNPGLFDRLSAAFNGKVRIANAGQPLVVKRQWDPIKGRQTAYKEESGEEYRVCCPMCSDTRYRLYINHAWGLDRKHSYPSSKLVVCHNCHAESAEDELDPVYKGNVCKYLQAMLNPYLSDVNRGIVQLDKPAKEAAEAVGKKLPFPAKEWTTALTSLPEDHPAYKYLVHKRKFDLEYLETKWGATIADVYPVKVNGKDYSWLAGRVFFPTGDEGWQARAVDNVSKVKYFSCPGWRKSMTVYNLPNAKRYPFAVLGEGVTDVWRVGRPGIAGFGKQLSKQQAKLIAEQFDTVIFALDPDAHVADSPGRKPAARVSHELLKKYVRNVPVLRLPDGRDLGECTYDQAWDYIEAVARKANLGGVQRP